MIEVNKSRTYPNNDSVNKSEDIDTSIRVNKVSHRNKDN